jgi:pimeloyl-ACP methyl ester carboxylesterase
MMMGTFQHDGIDFRYESLGEGPDVIFCRGLGGDRRQPKGLIGRLEGYRLVVWDCRCHGDTRPVGPADTFGFGPMAEDLAALFDHLGIERAILGGISMGAGIAVRFAEQWPGRIEALMLVRPAWLVSPLPDNLAMFPRVADMLRQNGSEKGLAEFKTLSELAAIRQASPAMAESLCEQFTKPNAVERSVRLERIPADRPVDNWNVVELLDMPVLVLGNERDPVHPMAFAEAWAEHLPHADIERIASKSDSPKRHARGCRRHMLQFLQALELHRSQGDE